MKKRLTEEELRAKIKTLPVWMQDVCNAALAERDNARNELASHYAAQKPSAFYTYTYDREAGRQKQYIQGDTMVVEHAGIELEIRLRRNNTRDGKGIELCYGRPGGETAFDQIAIIPKVSNTIELRAVENMKQP